MEITTSGSKIKIIGNIKSISDYQRIRSTVDEMVQSSKAITIVLENSISIISSVIGYFNKLVLKDEISLNITVDDDSLYELFNDLGLVQLFRVQRV